MPPAWRDHPPDRPLDATDAEIVLLTLQQRLRESHEPIINYAAPFIARLPHAYQRATAWEGIAAFYETCARLLHAEADAERAQARQGGGG